MEVVRLLTSSQDAADLTGSKVVGEVLALRSRRPYSSSSKAQYRPAVCVWGEGVSYSDVNVTSCPDPPGLALRLVAQDILIFNTPLR